MMIPVDDIVRGVSPVFMFLMTLIIWVVAPGVILERLTRNKEMYPLGAILGFVALVTIGPWSKGNLGL